MIHKIIVGSLATGHPGRIAISIAPFIFLFGSMFLGVEAAKLRAAVKGTPADNQPTSTMSIDNNEIASVEKVGLNEQISNVHALSRRLRGGHDPSEVIPEIHDVIKSQLHQLQSMYKMHKEGDDAALATSIKNLVDETSSTPLSVDVSKELVSHGNGVTEEDLAVLDTVPDWDGVSDAQIIEHFNPSYLSEQVELLQDMNDILENVRPILQSSPSSKSRRHLKDDYNYFSAGGGGSSSSGGGSHGYPRSLGGFTLKLDKMERRARASVRSKMPNLSKYGLPHHGRRLEEKPQVCSAQCQPTDMSCMCKRLVGCVKKMNHYDMALMFAKGYVDEDPNSEGFAELSIDDVDLRLFDIDQNSYGQFDSIQTLAADIDPTSSQQCTKLLERFHSPCDVDDPLSNGECNEANTRSFQMTVDEVCDAVNNPSKLYFSVIGDVFDGYASTNGLDTDKTTCGDKRVGYESCRSFIEGFEDLYEARDQSKFPFPNPMRADPSVLIGDALSGGVLFPTKYMFDPSIYGVPGLDLPDISAVSTDGMDIRVVGADMCMDSGYGGGNEGNIYMSKCSGNNNQKFSYDRNTYQIKQDIPDGTTKCLDYDSGDSKNVYLQNCHAGLNQKWRYNTLTHDLSTFDDNKCIDWNSGSGGNNNIYMHDCNGKSNQRFNIPRSWFLEEPNISTGVLHQIRVRADVNKCMDSGYGGNNEGNIYMSNCAESVGTGNQYFIYDASTKQIKQDTPRGTKCLDYDAATKNVYLGDCHSGLNQMWRSSGGNGPLKTFQDEKCVDWNTGDNNNLYMHDCNSQDNQKFVTPFQWTTAMRTTSIQNTVMTWLMGQKHCMDGGGDETDDDGAHYVYMSSECGTKNSNVFWYYDDRTREVKVNNQCLDSDDEGSKSVVLNDCNAGVHQKWYYEPATMHLRHLSSDKCLRVESDKYLKMDTCNDGNKFHVPLTWLPAAYLGKIHVAYNTDTEEGGNTCMDARPDSNDNVWMTDCQDGNLNQDFYYDSRTRSIKFSGMCLDYHTSNSNVYLSECHYGTNQKWYYSGMSLRTDAATDKCLDWNTSDGNNNLYMYECTAKVNQKFMIPGLWGGGKSLHKSPSPEEFQVAGYHTRLIPTGIWNGQWDKRVGDNCFVDLMKDVLETCDASMTLLLGETTSVGTLHAIAHEVKENGSRYMPGTCCLDDATTSEWYGFNYNEGVSFIGDTMECMNRGPWHLGISREACESAGGRYFRSPCYTLQDCINDRPSVDEVGYSDSFENFTARLLITDPTDDEQCRNARTGLGFQPDYAHDVDVCNAFFEQQCDDFYASVDGLVGDLGYGDTTTKEFNTDTWQTPLPFKPLPKSGWAFTTVPADDGTSDKLGKMQYAWNAANAAVTTSDLVKDYYDAKPKCSDILPQTLTVGFVTIPNPFYIICLVLYVVMAMITYVYRTVIVLAAQALDFAYDIMTISPGRELEIYFLTQSIYSNLETYQPWVNTALQSINENIDKQHTAMHHNLNDFMTRVEGALGLGSDELKTSSDAVTSNSTTNEGGEGELGEQYGSYEERKIVEIQSKASPAKYSNERTVDSTVVGVQREVVDLSEVEMRSLEDKLNSLEDTAYGGIASLEEKVDGLVGGVSDVSLIKAKVESMDGRMNTLEDKVDALTSMISQLVSQNQKMLETNSKSNRYLG